MVEKHLTSPIVPFSVCIFGAGAVGQYLAAVLEPHIKSLSVVCRGRTFDEIKNKGSEPRFELVSGLRFLGHLVRLVHNLILIQDQCACQDATCSCSSAVQQVGKHRNAI
jgi:hypothetical protein